jgi:hypothetical protein
MKIAKPLGIAHRATTSTSFARAFHLGEAGPLSQRGLKAVGRHSEHAIYTAQRCIGRGLGGSSGPPSAPRLFLPRPPHVSALALLAVDHLQEALATRQEKKEC